MDKKDTFMDKNICRYYATNSVGKKLNTNGVWALMFSLLHIARGLDWHSKRNIIETFLVKVT